MQLVPGAPGVSTATTCVVPLVIVAHATSTMAETAKKTQRAAYIGCCGTKPKVRSKRLA
jgi:hypothetical protein